LKGGKLESASVTAPAELREVVCEVCDFYKPGDPLECGAYRILKLLVESGKLSIEDLRFASETCKKLNDF